MSMKKGMLIAAVLSVIISGWAGISMALKAPHDKVSNNITCSSCHFNGGKIRTFKPLCTVNCHNSSSTNPSRKKAMDTQYMADPFGTFTWPDIVRKPRSHAYATMPNYSAAGMNNKRAGTNKSISINQTNIKMVTGTSTVICSKCHYAHGSDNASLARNPFLRATPKGDYICFQCHEERRVGAGSAHSAPVAGKAYSHPVEVNYSTIRAAKPEMFETTPTNTYGLQAANLPLYTTYDDVKGAVICSTCHGPMHSADSNPYTLDNMSAFSYGVFSTTNNNGKLLRRYPPSVSDNMCLACHKVSTHKTYKCGNCHEPHKRQGENNIYLIRQIINTPYGNHSVFFTSTTQMAKRYGIYSGGPGNYKVRSTAICQVCHTNNAKTRHYSYSTAGGDLGHNYLGPNRFAACIGCHPHNASAGGFSPEGCASCHLWPPADTYGRHGKHTNGSAKHDWETGAALDARSADSYGFACSRCHVKWNPYTGFRHNGTVTLGLYTAEVDFKYTASLPSQDTSKATYVYGASGSVDNGSGGYTFRTPNVSPAGSCRNLYCHGQFYNGYTSNDPIWNSTSNQPCGKCHGVAYELGKGVPGNTGGVNWGAHPKHSGNGTQQYGVGGNFRCNACHAVTATQNAISTIGLDRERHVNGRINLKFYSTFGYSASNYDTLNNYSAAIPNTTFTKKAYKTCKLIYCHSDGSRMKNYSAASHSYAMPYPNWSTSSKNFTTSAVSGIKPTRCIRCHGNSTFKGITAAMPGVTTKGNSHEKHIRNGFLCYACHSQTVVNTSRSINSFTKHVNKTYDVDIDTRYGGTYDNVTKVCSNVKCHGGRATIPWGTNDTNNCRNCHFKNSAESVSDKGFRDSYAWKSMTSTASVPRIYSTEWAKSGHGRAGASQYPSSDNYGANKSCMTCHKASGTKSHFTDITGNPFRLATAVNHSDDLCQQCHAGSAPGAGSGGADAKVLTHYTTGWSGWGTPRASWPFKPKCVDCHDPHGDNNNRYMIKAYINYSGSSTAAKNFGKRTYDLTGPSQMLFSSAGGNMMNWSSYVKSSFTGICQRCHATQANMAHFRKYSTATGGDGYDAGHNPKNRCTGCHRHDQGFKGKDCGECHKFPPVLSGKHAMHTVSTVTKGYPTYENKSNATRYAFDCGKCHSQNNSQHIERTIVSGIYTTEVVFDGTNKVPRNPNGGYAFGARSSIDTGYTGTDNYSWVSTTGTCSNLYCHGQFFGGMTGNDPKWYNNGADDPQTCGKCHRAVKNSSGSPTGGAHNKHVTTFSMPCRTCHRATTGGFDAYTVTNKAVHVDGMTNIRLYTTSSDATVGSRIGRYARYGNSSNDFANVTTNTNPGAVPTYRYCQNIYCHSRGTSTLNPYTSKDAYPNYTAFWGYTTNQRTPAGQGCALCHGNKIYSGITAAMPDQATGNSHKKHVIGDQVKCYVCHSNVVDANGNIATPANHVNKFKNISIILRYKTGQTGYSTTVAAKKTCKNVKCHGGRITPLWGNGADCRVCHFKNTAEASTDEGFKDSYAWKAMTSTVSVPRIYSSEWVKYGHGRYSTAGSGGRYPSSGNKSAGKTCTACHKASSPTVGHSTALSGNQYRLYTAPGHIDDMCKECHTASGARSSEATTRVKGHTAAELAAGNATWQFTPKCIDCHDPHGDKNRYMVQQFVNYSGSDTSGRRTYDLTPGVQMTFSTIGAQIQWSSYVKSTFDGMCQRCHNVQTNMTNFRKNLFTRTHNAGSRCTTCHKHSDGFRGSGCNGCHNFPPALSGKHSFHVATTVPGLYVNYSNAATTKKYAFGCGKCHNSGSHYVGSGNYTTEVVFDSTNNLPKNSGTYIFGARSSIDTGASGTDSYTWTSTKGTCANLYCHGQFFGGITGNDPNWYNNGADDPQNCGKCHGAVKNGSIAPSGGAHNKHVTNYGFKCRFCHRETSGAFDAYTVIDRRKHSNGKTEIRLYTTESRVGGNARYGNAGSEFVNVTTNRDAGTVPTYRYCKSTYCHSSGQTLVSPYALPNYTAFWGYTTNQRTSASSKGCNLCHGNKTYAGVTAAMPAQVASNSHVKHVVTEKIKCAACHANVVDMTGSIVSASNHVNKFKNISIMTTYKSGATNYVDGTDTCANVKCHGNRTTPAWGNSTVCQNCHYQTGATEDNFAWTNFSGTNMAVAKIYSSEWAKRGHGKTKASGKYPFSNNSGAGKTCDNCHRSQISHNQSNYFRIITANGNSAANPDLLCARCHGSGSQLQSGFGRITGIVSHTYVNMSTLGGYKGGTNGKAGWNFTPKCVDCHDPHGDTNNAMLHTFINQTGSDTYGKPSSLAQAQAYYTAVGGQMAWSSFVRNTSYNGICQRCHSAEVDFFDKAQFGNPVGSHNNASGPCKNCHKHKKGFSPSGCDSCHGDGSRNMGRSNWTPPKGPGSWSDSMTNKSSLHQPHAYNPRSRAGFGNKTGFACEYCHDDSVPASNHNSSKSGANMNNLTSSSGYSGRDNQSDFAYGTGTQNPANDTCWNTTCHTPRAYVRTWQKPKDCDDCHGTIRLRGATERGYKLHTTNSHKIHINYTGTANPTGKNYRFACSNCHYNWQTNNNYSTHYNGQVNVTSAGPINTVGAAGGFYGRGRTFKGFSTGNDLTATNTACTKVYCHGNFPNGTTATKPYWKKGQTTVHCGSCHRAKTGKITNWQNGTSMPARHPKHVRTATYNFACNNCHVRTVTNNTTVYFQYSAHVNGTVNVTFGSFSGTFDSGTKRCLTSYCHSRGNTQAAPYSMANFTAQWDQTAVSKTGTGKECSFCHGSKSTYAGITAAMPNQGSNNSHPTHVITEKFKCYVCHSNVVNANGAIVSYSNHVNKFKNISIITLYKTGQERYSSTVAAKKTCKNIKCHAGRTTPLWGNTGKCQDCHYQTGGTEDNFVWTNFTGASFAAAKIYSSEWAKFGHGRSGSAYPSSGNPAANKACTNCHNSGVKHNTATNPFRLHTSDSTKVCASCHGSGAELAKWGNTAANMTSIVTHSYTATKGNAGWNFGTHFGSDPKRAKCVDCHDPHGDKNRSMIHTLINYTGSNTYGLPSPLAAQGAMNFSTIGANINWSSYVNSSKTGICQRCHSPSTVDSNMLNFSKDLFSNHNNGSKCVSCHKHKKGFKGGGESTGNQNCTGCHTLDAKMSSTGTYHHVIKSVNYNYVNWSSSDGTLKNFTTTARRCVMCHVDHDDFSPAAAKGAINKRAQNLRVSAVQSRTTGINTDFWPAKRRNATGRTGADAGTGNYSSTYPISGPSGSNGVCISCHDQVQYKNTSAQKDSDGSRRARNFAVSLYTSSSHNFQVISGWNNFGDGSSFRANCTKCHRSDFIDQAAAQTGRAKFGLHDNNYPSLLYNMTGSTQVKPMIEQLCYNCHSGDNYSSSKYDYYSSVKMSSGAKMIKTAIEAKSSGHPIDDAAMAGRHKPDEFYNVTGTVAANSNPPSSKFWNFSSSRHIECVDCHNTHGGNASIKRVEGGPFKGRILPSGSYVNYSAGNKVAGAQAGAWGVSLDYAGTTKGQTPKFTKVSQVKYQYELCIKCHSNFAYGANPRGVPSGLPDPNGRTAAPYDILDTTVPQANIAAMINPNNYGYHPIYQKGRNQPSKSLNSNWPAAKSNWMYRDKMTNRTAFISVSGLSWNFVPPYSQHSLLACSDCHQSDNTGQAIAKGPITSVVTSTGWTNATVASLQSLDATNMASTTGTNALKIQVQTNGSGNEPTAVYAVGYGYATTGTANGRKQNMTVTSNGSTLIGVTGTATIPLGTSPSRYEYNTTGTSTWAVLNAGSATVQQQPSSAITTIYVDYLGIEAVFVTSGDVRGPHGSLEKWITTDVDKNINFDANNDGDMVDAGDKPNSGFSGNALKIFCWNCHRSDIYYNSSIGGGSATLIPNYSRMDHSSGTVAEPFDDPFTSANIKNVWGIACYNCHAGGGVGEIHGSFKNSTTPQWWYPSGAAASRIKLGRPMGVRLLNGAGFALDPATSTCYSPADIAGGTRAAPYASNCGSAKHSAGGVTTTFNYTYTAW